MKNEVQEQKLIDFAKQTLDHSIKDLDPDTLSRLQSARLSVCSNASEPHSWTPPAWAVVAACLVVFTISFSVWKTNSPEVTARLPFDEVEILASADGWEFYEDLEFYSWLAEDDQTG